MNPTLIPHHQIDKIKWDNCIRQSSHPLTTAESWYLDLVAPRWSALVADDYLAVMPLPFIQKGVFRFLTQPLWVQQLGIFSPSALSPGQADLFYRKAKSMRPFLNLHTHNPLPKMLQLARRTNYILSLNHDIQTLQAGYSKNCRRNLKKAESYSLSNPDHIDTGTFINFSRNHTQYHFPSKGWIALEQILNRAIAQKKGFCRAVADANGNHLAMAFFLQDKHRITFLSGTSSPQGLEKKAMFRIIHQTIEKFSNQNLLLDFEGSSIDSIARFYEGFGGSPEYYYQWVHPIMRVIFQFREIIKPKR